LFFWRELVCKEKESLNILFILFLLCWNCKKKNAYSDFLGEKVLKKTRRHQHLQTKELNKIIEFSGFFGEKNCHLATQKKIKNPTMGILGFFCKICHILREIC
jgi:hypothetical protein